MTDTRTLDILDKAEELLAGGEMWFQGGPEMDGRMCVMRALGNSAKCTHPGYETDEEAHRDVRRAVNQIYRIMDDIIHEQFPDRLEDEYGLVIAEFNDNRDTSWPDIQVVFDKTRAQLEEKA